MTTTNVIINSENNSFIEVIRNKFAGGGNRITIPGFLEVEMIGLLKCKAEETNANAEVYFCHESSGSYVVYFRNGVYVN